jgi:hypothetical protein
MTTFDVPTIDETFPAPLSTTPTDPLDFQPLLAAVVSGTSAGTLTGELGAPASHAGKYGTVGSGGAHIRGRGGRRVTNFSEGTIIACDGQSWFEAYSSGSIYWPKEMDRQLAIVHVGAGMLSSGQRFALDLPLQLALRGNVTGGAILRMVVGSVTLAPSGSSIASIAWSGTPIFEQAVFLTPATLAARIGYSVTRAGDVLTATKTIFGTVSASTVVPASPVFALKAELVRFDVEDSASARGALAVKLLKPACSIITL